MCERGIRGFTRKDEVTVPVKLSQDAHGESQVEQHRRHEHGVDARWDAGFHG